MATFRSDENVEADITQIRAELDGLIAATGTGQMNLQNVQTLQQDQIDDLDERVTVLEP